ncbi:hypothetical protein VB711_06925 [Cronbergia sp. UHCC 0137]|nr:hypothetical protein [Cronbergia sp. UHCC 0137]MEA5617571.1 hypothetical protein [Cronbergia sp. UHCC 0137]
MLAEYQQHTQERAQLGNTSVSISSDIPLVMGGEGYILGNAIAHG